MLIKCCTYQMGKLLKINSNTILYANSISVKSRVYCKIHEFTCNPQAKLKLAISGENINYGEL